MINVSVGNPIANYRTTQRKRSEIRRQYKANLEQIHEGKIEIIAYDDERLNYLERAKQDWVIELNQLIKSEGEHLGDDEYLITNEEKVEEVRDEMDRLVAILGLRDEMVSFMILQMILGALLLLILFIMIQKGSPYEAVFRLLS